MNESREYKPDIDAILAKRYDNGADYWTTPDKRLGKGGPFSTLSSVLLLLELGMDPADNLLKKVADLIFGCQREDGRFKLSPSGAIYPCHTINAANVLSNLGYSTDSRLEKTFKHLLEIQFIDGGWRCKKFSYGRGPETEFSNPGPTLTALNAFRFTDHINKNVALDRAVEFLLDHWEIRKPIGPCHYGMGTLFMQVEYPFLTYNLFYYVYVLSFYDRAKRDERFLEALQMLESKMVDGKIVVERTNSKLAKFDFCKKGEKSILGTERYLELKRNLNNQK
ncbi:prenyltransferase/squalene oxidase repeat-containing protein [Alkalibacter mobilis]|uniref:prenyltransferase n=1 Tax=Alkalibacter mobilis TaxID=2787712 RepID=UPI00189F7AC6|nr:prenyltransferase [Alkalibacter mobilis]